MKHRLLINEVTTYGKLRCVAGYNFATGGMIRPEPSPGGFWPSYLTGQATALYPGNVMDFEGTIPDTEFPHRREDRVVNVGPTIVSRLTTADFASNLAAIGSTLSKNTFDHFRVSSSGTAYVEAGTDCGSLFGVQLPKGSISLEEVQTDRGPRLRCSFELHGSDLCLSVAATDIRNLHERSGLAAVRNGLNNQTVHLRIGLARGWGDFPNRCYMQVNGIYPI